MVPDRRQGCRFPPYAWACGRGPPRGQRGWRLGQHRIEVLGQKGAASSFSILMQGVFAKAILFPQRREGGGSLLFVGTGDGTCCLPSRISLHAPQTALSFGEHGIV